jgi:2-keto-4-pentenoate hydratase
MPETQAQAQSPVGVEAGMRALLARRSAELEQGAAPVGWKIGFNTPAIQAHFGISGAVVGYLTDTTVIDAGDPIDLSGWQRPALEVEVAIRVGDNGGVGALGPALELVDLDLPFDRLEPILAGNVFHRGVVFGPESVAPDLHELAVAVVKDGEQVADGLLRERPEATIGVVRAFLGAHGARLRPGERIIAGSLIAPMDIAPGDRLDVSFGVLGSLSIAFC